MTWTKQNTETLPALGNRTVRLSTVDGVQMVNYHVVSNSGQGYDTSFTVAAVLQAHPEIDAAVLATYLAIFRSYGDTACGFADV
jgi:hypothetical protein